MAAVLGMNAVMYCNIGTYEVPCWDTIGKSRLMAPYDADDWAALVAAVCAAPAADLPRLVAADWLDEHGRPGHADFIRTQVEAARSAADPALSDRAAVLFEAAKDYLFDALTPFAGGRGINTHRHTQSLRSWPDRNRPGSVAWEVRRGFVSAVSLPMWAWDVVGPAAVRRFPIETVSLKDRWPAFGATVPLDGPVLRYGLLTKSGRMRRFTLRANAEAAVSRACIAWAKSVNRG